MSRPSVFPIPAFHDNYIWAIVNKACAVVVDPGEAAPVLDFLESTQRTLTDILITHHHHDHVGGVDELVKRTGAKVYRPAHSPFKISGVAVRQNDSVTLPSVGLSLSVIETPGHTLDHVCYYGAGLLFCGDTLFSVGCGRLFEGTPLQMWASLKKLSELPDSTSVYCAHEYTESNIAFALACDGTNPDLRAHHAWVVHQRSRNLPTLPSTMAKEKKINPFLRSHASTIRHSMLSRQPNLRVEEVELFAALRQWKDHF